MKQWNNNNSKINKVYLPENMNNGLIRNKYIITCSINKNKESNVNKFVFYSWKINLIRHISLISHTVNTIIITLMIIVYWIQLELKLIFYEMK